ncbi:hypothetical protein KUTeg_001916 [Tegillarca granosa]|uniref:Uncharacterized protein n=1 Tax=Tegillarca granosa TaxID=220873 RepID=A0ABQ9FST0_TEGGR|nr:hypothetical protein KUTeg_001916 [Tegillarca granosa]
MLKFLKVLIIISVICIEICSCRRRHFNVGGIQNPTNFLGLSNTRARRIGDTRTPWPAVCPKIQSIKGTCIPFSLGSGQEAAAVCAYCQHIGYQFCINLFCA